MLIRKLFKAEMAHHVPGAYTARCHNLHGHSYKFELFVRSSQPNDTQMVSDFKAVKEVGINDFFDSFDHAVMVWEKASVAKILDEINPERHIRVPFIPTAEMMAKAFFVVCEAILSSAPKLTGEKDVHVDHVIVHETETGAAQFGRTDLKDDKFPDIEFHRWVFSSGIKAAWKNKTWFKNLQTPSHSGSSSPALQR